MSKKKSKKKTKRTYTAVQDIEKLLTAEPPVFSVITGAAGCHKNKIDTEEAARQRMRSDESISFAWCKGSSIIHDKTCDLIKMCIRDRSYGEANGLGCVIGIYP